MYESTKVRKYKVVVLFVRKVICYFRMKIYNFVGPTFEGTKVRNKVRNKVRKCVRCTRNKLNEGMCVQYYLILSYVYAYT
jgi:hypothetical protein